ncbi:hypothetical protein V6X63_09895 [Spiribacter sp. 221]|uniref:hypothetical protein n=1 Tax=Spiribacter onubensis TaxID=3122420 RepID=UPI00349F2800
MSDFGVIHAERIRAAAPAVQAVAKNRAQRGAAAPETHSAAREARALLGVLKRCYEASRSLAAIQAAPLILPQRGHKYDEARAELYAAGLEPGMMVLPSSATNPGVSPRALVATLQALPMLRRCRRSRRLKPYAEVLACATAFTWVLRRREEEAHWIIVGDLSPFLIALAAACRGSGQRVVYWQYSYLDFKPLPVSADAAILLNDTGRKLACIGPTSPAYWRPREAVRPVRLDGLGEGSVGAMLNVQADERALERLEALARRLGRPVEVRLHPNSTLARHPWPETLSEADTDEDLADFVRRHKVLVAGNTQAQAKALTLGTPVVQLAGLDPLPFDHHEYVRNGIVLGIQSLEQFSFEAVRAFYADERYQEELSALMGPPPEARKPGLEQFIAHLMRRGYKAHPLYSEDSL